MGDMLPEFRNAVEVRGRNGESFDLPAASRAARAQVIPVDKHTHATYAVHLLSRNTGATGSATLPLTRLTQSHSNPFLHG